MNLMKFDASEEEHKILSKLDEPVFDNLGSHQDSGRNRYEFNTEQKGKRANSKLSLREIIESKLNTKVSKESDKVEMYSMPSPEEANIEEEDQEISFPETTLIVKRLDLTFNNRDCQLITFIDITAFRNLDKAKKMTQTLKIMNRAVSHELLAPLSSTVQLA